MPFRAIQVQAIALHGRIPGIRVLPRRAVAIILMLMVANVLVWVAVGVVLVGSLLNGFQKLMLVFRARLSCIKALS